MSNYERIPKLESPKPSAYCILFVIRYWDFFRRLEFVIRHFPGPSRRQALEQPGVVGPARIPKAIVQAVGPSLPEFDLHRCKDVAAPIRGQGNVAGIFLLELFEPCFEHRAASDDLALRRNPRAELVTARAAREILLGFFT